MIYGKKLPILNLIGLKDHDNGMIPAVLFDRTLTNRLGKAVRFTFHTSMKLIISDKKIKRNHLFLEL